MIKHIVYASKLYKSLDTSLALGWKTLNQYYSISLFYIKDEPQISVYSPDDHIYFWR